MALKSKSFLDNITNDKVVALLQELVSIRCEPEARLYEKQLAEFISERLNAAGFEVELIEKEPDRPSVLARLKGTGTREALVLYGHLSAATTILDDWTVSPFAGEVRDGKLYGVGVADMKGGLASMMVAAQALLESDTQLMGDLILMFGSGAERAGTIGAKYVLEQKRLKAAAAIVGEPSALKIIIAERGAVWFEMKTKGVSGLSGVKGTNAVEKTAQVIVALQELRVRLNSRRHPLLTTPSVSVNQIAGGIAPYTVPSSCQTVIDRRLIVGETTKEAIDEMRLLITDLCHKDKELEVNVEPILEVEPFETSPKEKIVTTALSSLKEVTGREGEIGGFLGWTEGVHFVEAGIPTIIMGPGDISVVHAPDEYVEVQQLRNAAEIYALTALNMLR